MKFSCGLTNKIKETVSIVFNCPNLLQNGDYECVTVKKEIIECVPDLSTCALLLVSGSCLKPDEQRDRRGGQGRDIAVA